MDKTALVTDEWQYVLNMMPPDLEESAVEKLALVRRREIGSAADLLRMALCYGLCDLSLRQTAAWAKLNAVGELSDVAVLKRLRGASDWLGHLVLRWMQERGLTSAAPAARVQVLDASTISGPGSRGTDWRLHLGLDLAHLTISSVQLTGPEGGESLLRHQLAPGQMVVGDRAYANRPAVAAALERAVHVVIRSNWQYFPLSTRRGAALDLLRALELLEPGEIGDWPVQLQAQGRRYPLRLIALRKSQAAAHQEIRRLRRIASRKNRPLSRDSRRDAHFIYLITDLPAQALPAAQALELYRLRWQIELFFKRLKGIVHIDKLRAKDQRLSRTYLYANLLGALIADELCQEALAFFPWGYPLRPATRQPVAATADGG